MPREERESWGHWKGFHLGGCECILTTQTRKGLSGKGSRVSKEGERLERVYCISCMCFWQGSMSEAGERREGGAGHSDLCAGLQSLDLILLALGAREEL